MVKRTKRDTGKKTNQRTHTHTHKTTSDEINFSTHSKWNWYRCLVPAAWSPRTKIPWMQCVVRKRRPPIKPVRHSKQWLDLCAGGQIGVCEWICRFWFEYADHLLYMDPKNRTECILRTCVKYNLPVIDGCARNNAMDPVEPRALSQSRASSIASAAIN